MVYMKYFKEICCFILIAETFLKLCPNKKYEEYIHMIIGFICIAVVLTPVLVFVKGNQAENLPTLETFEVQLQKVLEESEREMQEELEEKFKEGWKVDEETEFSTW